MSDNTPSRMSIVATLETQSRSTISPSSSSMRQVFAVFGPSIVVESMCYVFSQISAAWLWKVFPLNSGYSVSQTNYTTHASGHISPRSAERRGWSFTFLPLTQSNQSYLLISLWLTTSVCSLTSTSIGKIASCFPVFLVRLNLWANLQDSSTHQQHS